MKHAIVFLPSNLDLEEVIKKNPPDFQHHIDCFKFLISEVVLAGNSKEDKAHLWKFNSLQATVLQKRVHQYKKYFQYLEMHGVIEIDHHYTIGEKSKGYRLAAQYRTELKTSEIKKPTLLKNLSRQAPQEKEAGEKLPYLRKWFNTNLKIDYEAGMEYLKQELQKNQKGALERYNAGFIAVNSLHNRKYLFSIDQKIHRLHTNLTMMPRVLRNFLTYAGEKLVCVDISNSIPFISNILVNPDFYKMDISNNQLNIYTISQTNPNLYPLTSTSITHDIPSFIMLAKMEGHTGEEFMKLTENGNLYEYFQKEFHQQTGKSRDRKKMKNYLLIALNTGKLHTGKKYSDIDIVKKILKKLSPVHHEVYDRIKHQNYLLLPWLLMTIESQLVLDLITKRISKEKPDITIYTIHDGIACPKGNEGYVKQVVEEELLKAIGICANTKPEFWEPNNLSQPPEKGIVIPLEELKSSDNTNIA